MQHKYLIKMVISSLARPSVADRKIAVYPGDLMENGGWSGISLTLCGLDMDQMQSQNSAQIAYVGVCVCGFAYVRTYVCIYMCMYSRLVDRPSRTVSHCAYVLQPLTLFSIRLLTDLNALCLDLIDSHRYSTL